MKKAIGIMCILILVCACCSCGKEQPVLAQNTLYAYHAFMDDTPEAVEFVLKGEIPSTNEKSGVFSGHIEVKESDGTKHIYQKLQYVWVDEMLLLHCGDPTAEESKGVLCWVDPQSPERTFIADRNWCERNPEQEIIAYVCNDLSDAEKKALSTKIAQIRGVKNVQFVTAEQALESFFAHHENNDAFSGVDASYIRARYIITIETEKEQQIISQIEEIAGIEEVSAPLWAAESIRLIGPEKEYERMNALFWQLPELPK